MSLKHKWYTQPEMIVGLSALLVSFVAVAVSLYSASIDRAYARASVWPELRITRSDIDFANPDIPYFSIALRNSGTGPARIKFAKVTYKGVPYKTWDELLKAADVPVHRFIQSTMTTVTIPAMEYYNTVVAKHPEMVSAFRTIDKDIDISVCFCSIYDECWLEQRRESLQPVEQCEIDEKERFLQ